MKHCILAKFKDEYKYNIDEYLPDIMNIFNELKTIEGVHDITYRKNITDKPNRSTLLIVIDLEPEAMDIYSPSAPHMLWKEKYGPLLESKAIFDYED